jgi:TPR repeat protein
VRLALAAVLLAAAARARAADPAALASEVAREAAEIEQAARLKPAQLEELCTDGAAGSCVGLGEKFLLGEKVPKDKARALDLFSRACELGWLTGCVDLGLLYLDGVDAQGARRDPDRGARLIARGCEEDAAGDSCAFAARLYELGEHGVRPRPELARRYYALSCAGGVEESCAALARLKTPETAKPAARGGR